MNKKGFMMAELVVVSAIILVTLVGLYTSYNKIYSTYRTRLNYYDITTLYRLGFYRDILKENNELSKTINNSRSGVVEVYNSKNKIGNIFSLPETEIPKDANDVVYFIYNNKKEINKSVFEGRELHVTFLEYIDYFNDSIDYSKFKYVMIMERCAIDDEDNCNYAYLELPE